MLSILSMGYLFFFFLNSLQKLEDVSWWIQYRFWMQILQTSRLCTAVEWPICLLEILRKLELISKL